MLQHRLNFRPLPHGQGSFRPGWAPVLAKASGELAVSSGSIRPRESTIGLLPAIERAVEWRRVNAMLRRR